MSATNYLENALANHITNNTPFAQPSQLWIGLIQGTVANQVAVNNSMEAGEFTYELVAGGYSRQPITFNPSVKVGAGYTATSDYVTFPKATTQWNDIRYCIITDAPTGGNLLFWTDTDNQNVPIPVGCAFRTRVELPLR
jgi:hypothetical protein